MMMKIKVALHDAQSCSTTLTDDDDDDDDDVCVCVCACVVVASIRCSVCDSSKGNNDCVTRPPAPQFCEGFDYCIAVAKYTNDGR